MARASGARRRETLRAHGRPVQDWPIIAIHAVLNPDGTLLTFGADGDLAERHRHGGRKRHDTWNPRIGLHATVAQESQDYFCSATLLVPDAGPASGKVMIAGRRRPADGGAGQRVHLLLRPPPSTASGRART